MARMSKAAKREQRNAQDAAALAAMEAARDSMIAAYTALQDAGASFDATEALGDAINDMHDRIANHEKTIREFDLSDSFPARPYRPELVGFADPMHY